MIGVHHDASNTQLLVDATHHHAFIHRLILATDEVAIEVDIKIVECLAARKRNVSVDVVHIEGMGWHRHATIAQHVRAIGQGMHQKVLRKVEVAYLVPTHDPVLAQGKAIVYGDLLTILDMLVDVVGHHEIHAKLHANKLA